MWVLNFYSEHPSVTKRRKYKTNDKLHSDSINAPMLLCFVYIACNHAPHTHKTTTATQVTAKLLTQVASCSWQLLNSGTSFAVFDTLNWLQMFLISVDSSNGKFLLSVFGLVEMYCETRFSALPAFGKNNFFFLFRNDSTPRKLCILPSANTHYYFFQPNLCTIHRTIDKFPWNSFHPFWFTLFDWHYIVLA